MSVGNTTPTLRQQCQQVLADVGTCWQKPANTRNYIIYKREERERDAYIYLLAGRDLNVYV